MTETALHHFEAGNLQEAVRAASERVKAAPDDIRARSELAEYLCLSGELERAERQFDAIATQDPSTMVRVSELRQLVRAGLGRREAWRDGRMPELLSPPPDHLRLRLEALMHLREGRAPEAAAAVAAAEAARPALAGTRDGRAFDDLRDMDDLIGGVLEVMSTTGKYFWVPLEHVIEAVVERPSRPIDAGWCAVELTVRDGPTGRVMIPSIYPERGEAATIDGHRLGRETDWVEEPGGWTAGRGLRCFLVGEESVSIRELGTVSIEART